MIDIPKVMRHLRPEATWILDGDDYEGLTMTDGTEPPSFAEIEAAWPTVQAARWTATMRADRDRLLAASDWAMTSDAPTDKQAWTDYRQTLRDFPATWTPGPVADFPDPPA
jgi:hypothetical protein